MFEMNGAFTGPVADVPETLGDETVPAADAEADAVDTTLVSDPNKRKLVAEAGMEDFCLVHGNTLTGLSARIGGLRKETEEARKQYGELRKERVVLSRLRDTQQ